MEHINADWIRANADAIAAVINATRQIAQQQQSQTPDGYCIMHPLEREAIPTAESSNTSTLDDLASLAEWILSQDGSETRDLEYVQQYVDGLNNDYATHRETLSRNMDTIREAPEETEEQEAAESDSFEEGLEQPQGGGCHDRVTIVHYSEPVTQSTSPLYSIPQWFRDPEPPSEEPQGSTRAVSTEIPVPATSLARQEVAEIETIEIYDSPPPPRPWVNGSPAYDVTTSPPANLNPPYYMRDLLRYSEMYPPPSSSPSYSPVTSPTGVSLTTHFNSTPTPSPNSSNCLWSCWRAGSTSSINTNSVDYYYYN